MKLKHYDNLIIAFMALIAFCCLYMLYGVKYFAKSANDGPIVASIIEQVQVVKRKKDFYQSWMDVKSGDSLSQNDEIYTHGQSSAKISFQNGQEINLSENSLLRIKSQNQNNILSLERGNLTAQLSPQSPKLDLMVGGKKYSVESKHANIQIEQGKTENKFLLLEGNAQLNIGEKKEALSANQVLIQNKSTGDLKIKKLPFALKLPLLNSVHYFKNPKELNFSWIHLSGLKEVKITIAEDSSFTKIITSENIGQNNYQHLFDKAGTYYWKLTSPDNLDSPIRSFTLVEEIPLSLSLEKNIVYKGTKPSAVFVHWTADKVKSYVLKIRSPSDEIQELKLAENYFHLTNLKTGKYQISVKVNATDRNEAIWSAPAELEVLDAKAISITSNTPDTLTKIMYSNQAIKHLLSWNGPDSDVTYNIKLTYKNTSKHFQTESTNYPLTIKEPGEYEWTVQAESSSGILSNPLSGKIILKTPVSLTTIPSEGTVIELEKPNQLVSFKWNQAEANSHYQFELSEDPSFQQIIYEKEVESTNVSTALEKTGKYFWRVKIKKGDTIEYSHPISVEIKPTPPLSRPDILPGIKIKIKYLNETSFLNSVLDFFISKTYAADPIAVAEWDLPANSKTKTYIVEIYEDQNLSKLITRIESPHPHVIWKNAHPGTFYWRVSYEDYWGRKTDFSKISTLSIEEDLPVARTEIPQEEKKLPPSPIELISPKHKDAILLTTKDDALFSWDSIKDAKNYELTIASDLEFQTKIFSTKTSNSKTKIICKDLKDKEGDYYWKVTSDKENTSKRRMFHATCAPIPAPPMAIQEKATEELKVQKLVLIGYSPYQLNYENKASEYSAKVSGTVLNSWHGTFQHPLEWYGFKAFNSSLLLSRGKVFNTITFTDLEIELKAKKFETQFAWGPALSFIKKTLYLESNLTITSSSQLLPLAGVFIQKDFERLSLDAAAKFGGAIDLHAGVFFKLKNNISLGSFFDSTTLTKEGSEHSFARFGVNLNYTFLFLENTK